MSAILVIIISCLAVFNLSLVSILSWFKSTHIASYFWLGWMCFASAAAMADNILVFTDNSSIILHHCAQFLNLSWGGFMIAFTQSLRNQSVKRINLNWKLFIPSYLYLPFVVLTLFNPKLIIETFQLAKTGGMTLYGMFYNFIICFYTLFSNIYLLVQEYFNNKKYQISNLQSKRIKEILWLMLILQLMAFLPFMLKADVSFIILYMPVFGQIFFLYVFTRMTFSTNYLIDTIGATNGVKYAAIKIDNNKADELYTRILNYMDEEKPYLNVEFTLTEMAKTLSISTNILSMVINSRFNCSFPDLINSYRIKKAIELLENNDNKRYTIDAISYECGFNNRTSFYKAFRKQTGKLPSEYMKKDCQE